MHFNTKRTWLVLGALSLISLGCRHTRVVRQAPPPHDHGNIVVASRSAEDPSVFIVESPYSSATPTPAPTPAPSSASPVKAMPSTITPSPMPNVPTVPTEMPKRPVPPMPTELPKSSTLPPKVETSFKVSPDTLTLPATVRTPAEVPPSKPETRVIKPAITTATLSHAADYSWLIGRLEYSKSKQTWRIRYASYEVEDTFGGSVTLVGADDTLERYADGDLVKINGQLIDPELKTSAPPYRIIDVRKLN